MSFLGPGFHSQRRRPEDVAQMILERRSSRLSRSAWLRYRRREREWDL